MNKKQKVLDDLERVADKVGRVPDSADIQEHGAYAYPTYTNHLGSLSTALEQSDNKESSKKEDKKELLKTLRALQDDLNRVPQPTDLPEDCEYTRKNFYEKFGSWDEALEAIGIDKEQVLLDDLERVANKIGRVPDSADIQEHGSYAYRTYKKYFDSLSTVLKIKQSSEEGPKEELLETLRTLRDDLNRVPQPTDLPEDYDYSPNDFYQKFGSWDEALEAAGIDIEQALLNNIEQVANKVGRVPRSADIDEHGAYSISTYMRYFDSLSTAIKRSNLDENREEDFLEILQSLDERLERFPKATDLRDMAGVTQHDYIRKFGSWDEALEAAGINKEQALIDDVQQVATEVDGIPNTTAVNRHGTYSTSIYQNFFDSWDAALEAAGLSTTATRTGKKQETEGVATDTATLPPSTPIDDIKNRVDGVGSSTIRAVKQAGYTTLSDLHGAQPEDITTYNGVGRTKALRLIRFATEHVSSSGTTTQPSADRHPPAERSEISHSNASAKIQPSALETSWESITNNERIDEQFLLQVTDVGRREDHRKSAQLNVQDKNGHELKVNIWSKHDNDWKFRKGRWYALENGLGKVWKSSDGTTQKKLSSTKDLNVIDLGSDFDPNAASIGFTSKAASETQQPEATTDEDVPESTSDSTSADENTSTTTNDVDSKRDDNSEADNDGTLDDIMSEFDIN